MGAGVVEEEKCHGASSERGDRIGLTPMLHFLFVPIAVRINSRVATEAETDRFHETRFVLFSGQFGRMSHCITYSQDIITIHTPTGHIVGTRFSVNLTDR